MTAGLAIYDTMQYIRCPVGTLAVGQAASMASLLLAAGEAGQRRSLPHRCAGRRRAGRCGCWGGRRGAGRSRRARAHDLPPRSSRQVRTSISCCLQLRSHPSSSPREARRPTHFPPTSLPPTLLPAHSPGTCAPPSRAAPRCSRVMVHQPSGGARGQATDIAIAAKEILKMRELLNGLYVKHTGQTAQRVGEFILRHEVAARRTGCAGLDGLSSGCGWRGVCHGAGACSSCGSGWGPCGAQPLTTRAPGFARHKQTHRRAPCPISPARLLSAPFATCSHALL